MSGLNGGEKIGRRRRTGTEGTLVCDCVCVGVSKKPLKQASGKQDENHIHEIARLFVFVRVLVLCVWSDSESSNSRPTHLC